MPSYPHTPTISLSVGGRFHSDHMASALLEAGYEVALHTSLPKSRFGELGSARFRTHVASEVFYRLGANFGFGNLADHWKMQQLGRSLARDAKRSDILIAWSSFGLEGFRKTSARKILMRDSSHISFQTQWLAMEYARLGMKFASRRFCEERELEEYTLSDRIWVLSEFAKKSFLDKGVSASKLSVLRLGVDTRFFSTKPKRSIQLPLKAVFFGTIGVRKGVHHLLEATKDFSPTQLQVTLIGPIERGFERVLKRYPHFSYLPPLSHSVLGKALQAFDLFLFPTMEDGFGQTFTPGDGGRFGSGDHGSLWGRRSC
ncbi:MAG: glycosyltransferase [Bdellovibrionota bacterium]